jgi:Bax protein
MMRDQQHNPTMAAIGLLAVAVCILALYFWLKPDTEHLPNFSSIEDIELRKASFFDYLAPIVIAENQRVRAQRERLIALREKLQSQTALGALQRRWLKALAREYEVEWPGESPAQSMDVLLKRVDTVPVSLALTQAAKESGWGQSRFAREGNNLFGHWCYEDGCGIVPNDRPEGASHEVAAFDSVTQSVRRYINNLNTHPSYRPLRDIRASQRAAGSTPTGLALAEGLTRYSERRGAYVRDIKLIMQSNRALIDQAIEHAEASSSSGINVS